MNHSVLKKITISLLIAVILLILGNIIIDKYLMPDERPKNRETIPGTEIDNKFKTALKNYGFSSNWITKTKLRKKDNDSVFAAYSISVPKDVPVEMLLLELKEIFWDYNVDIAAEETETNKKISVQLLSGKNVMLRADFYYDEEIKREFGAVSFLVYNVPLEDDEVLVQLLNTPEHYSIVFVPSAAAKSKINIISNAEKRFAVLLNDDIMELDYKMASNFSEDRTLRSLREIVSTFSSAVFFIIDEKSDLYESRNFSFIRSQLTKRGIVLVPTNRFVELRSNGTDVESKFSNFMQSINKSDEKILMVTAEEFLNLTKLIPLYRKIGYKFINPGEIILRKTESN